MSSVNLNNASETVTEVYFNPLSPVVKGKKVRVRRTLIRGRLAGIFEIVHILVLF